MNLEFWIVWFEHETRNNSQPSWIFVNAERITYVARNSMLNFVELPKLLQASLGSAVRVCNYTASDRQIVT
jgi:hypothetical protein